MVPIEVRSMTEKTCREGLDLIFRKTVDVWTSRVDSFQAKQTFTNRTCAFQTVMELKFGVGHEKVE
jgi:hypothetical protein